jgi:hypothetical protein
VDRDVRAGGQLAAERRWTGGPAQGSDATSTRPHLCTRAKEKLIRDVLDLDEAKATRARIVVMDEPESESETVPLPPGWERMANGEPMPMWQRRFGDPAKATERDARYRREHCRRCLPRTRWVRHPFGGRLDRATLIRSEISSALPEMRWRGSLPEADDDARTGASTRDAGASRCA